MSDDPRATGAQGDSHSDLFLPRDPASQEQVRHVRAGNEQHKSDGAEQDEQGLANLTAKLGSEGNEQDSPIGIEIRIRLCQARCDRVHLSLRLLERDAGLESADGAGEAALTLAQLVRDLPWPPHLGRLAGHRCFGDVQSEVAGQDADDCDVSVVDREMTA